MSKELNEMLDAIRKENEWKGVLIVLHTTRENLPRLTKALKDAGLDENKDCVEVVPQSENQ
jgi:hypothetical protein